MKLEMRTSNRSLEWNSKWLLQRVFACNHASAIVLLLGIGIEFTIFLLEKSQITWFDFLKCREEIRFSIFDLRHLPKLSYFPTGMTHFFIFTAKKELNFFFQMAPTRGLYNQYFSSYDFFNLFLFFSIFTKIDIFHRS